MDCRDSLISAQTSAVPPATLAMTLVFFFFVFFPAFVATSFSFSSCWVRDNELVWLAGRLSSGEFDCVQPVAKVAVIRVIRIQCLPFIISLSFGKFSWVCDCWWKNPPLFKLG